ncbi:MAG: dienelactone hydrolase family protein [Betaproteobacteria bacterium]|nr:dienelactone hydrolase family protein [Betaproteobacteria bacterium]
MNPPTPFRTHVDFEGARIPVFVAHPAMPPRVTVVMLGAIWSVTKHIEDLCVKLTAEGFGAVAPCLYRGENIPARDAPPEVLRQTFLDFDDRRCVRDLRAVVRAAHDGRFGGEAGALVTWGFCLGGRFAHLLGALSEHVSGVVNFYGRQRFARQPNKPFLPIELTGLIEVPYLGHFAEFDELIPLGDVEELKAALAARGVPHQVHVYKSAKHSFFDPTRPADHDPRAAAQAWSRTLDFLNDLVRA